MKLSVVIPARDEEACLKESIEGIISELQSENIDGEIVVVNDNSKDKTEYVLKALSESYPDRVRYLNLPPPGGFGRGVGFGLVNTDGDVVVVAMADASDDPKDIVKYFRHLETNADDDCVFGSRFMQGANVKDYPKLKLFVNRLANAFIKVLFKIDHNDITNAFKAYRREVIENIVPVTSINFNITVELPLKAINRGFKYGTIPINWFGRTSGVSKHKIGVLGKKYLYTVLTLWLEKLLLSDELKKRNK